MCVFESLAFDACPQCVFTDAAYSFDSLQTVTTDMCLCLFSAVLEKAKKARGRISAKPQPDEKQQYPPIVKQIFFRSARMRM